KQHMHGAPRLHPHRQGESTVARVLFSYQKLGCIRLMLAMSRQPGDNYPMSNPKYRLITSEIPSDTPPEIKKGVTRRLIKGFRLAIEPPVDLNVDVVERAITSRRL